MINPTFLYIVAAVAAAGAALYLAFSRRWLQAGPEKGTIFDRLEGPVRLRDIFRLAVTIEDDGIIFYRSMAERAEDPAVKSLCSRLAEEETAHKALFEAQLGQWQPLPPHKLLFPALMKQARKKGIFIHPPGQEATESEMAAYAIGQEIKTVKFYQAFEKAFPQAWKRAHMHDLVLEEMTHEYVLRTAYPQLPGQI